MSRLQPSLREAEEQVASVERILANVVECVPCRWSVTTIDGVEKVTPDGFWVRFKRSRYGNGITWPMSDISARCTDCGGVLWASRDCGGQGFYYDPRWLEGNPAVRDPRHHLDHQARYACLPCFNRVRPKLASAERINEIRLMIGRIKREARHAA